MYAWFPLHNRRKGSNNRCFVNPWGITVVFQGSLVECCYFRVGLGGLRSSYPSFFAFCHVIFMRSSQSIFPSPPPPQAITPFLFCATDIIFILLYHNPLIHFGPWWELALLEVHGSFFSVSCASLYPAQLLERTEESEILPKVIKTRFWRLGEFLRKRSSWVNSFIRHARCQSSFTKQVILEQVLLDFPVSC